MHQSMVVKSMHSALLLPGWASDLSSLCLSFTHLFKGVLTAPSGVGVEYTTQIPLQDWGTYSPSCRSVGCWQFTLSPFQELPSIKGNLLPKIMPAPGQPASSDRSRNLASWPWLATLKGHPSFWTGHKVYCRNLHLSRPSQLPFPHRWCSQNCSSINCLHVNLCFRICFPGNLTYDGWPKKAASEKGFRSSITC